MEPVIFAEKYRVSAIGFNKSNTNWRIDLEILSVHDPKKSGTEPHQPKPVSNVLSFVGRGLNWEEVKDNPWVDDYPDGVPCGDDRGLTPILNAIVSEFAVKAIYKWEKST